MTVLIGIRANNLRRWPAPPLRVDSVHTPVWAARAPGFLFAILQSTGSRRTLAERPPKPASSAATSQQALVANFAWRNFRPTARCFRPTAIAPGPRRRHLPSRGRRDVTAASCRRMSKRRRGRPHGGGGSRAAGRVEPGGGGRTAGGSMLACRAAGGGGAQSAGRVEPGPGAAVWTGVTGLRRGCLCGLRRAARYARRHGPGWDSAGRDRPAPASHRPGQPP